MSIPIATTTISVLRSDQDGTKDVRSTLTYSTIASGVRAVIGAPSGAESINAGSSESVAFRLDSDVTDIHHADRIVDETTGETFEVTWVRRRIGLGLDHIFAELLVVTDRTSV